MNVGAADIYFKPSDLFFLIKLFACIGKVLNGKSAYICHYRLVKALL